MGYEVLIYQNGKVANRIKCKNKMNAKTTWIKESQYFFQYAQLVVDGRPYNTADTEAYFNRKMKDNEGDGKYGL